MLNAVSEIYGWYTLLTSSVLKRSQNEGLFHLKQIGRDLSFCEFSFFSFLCKHHHVCLLENNEATNYIISNNKTLNNYMPLWRLKYQ